MMIPHIRDYIGKRIHMIGIGGSSMSGLAQMLISKGYQVSGSDRTEGYLIGDVRAAGAKVFIGHAAERCARWKECQDDQPPRAQDYRWRQRR